LVGLRLKGIVPALGLALLAASCAGRVRDYGGVEIEQGLLRRPLDSAAVTKRSAAAIAIVETDVGRGMGFVIDPSGYLITNRHVLEDADHIEQVTFPAMDPPLSVAAVHVAYVDPLRDLALLKLDTSRQLPHLRLATRKIIDVADYLSHSDPVYVFGRAGDESAEPSLVLHGGKVVRLQAHNALAGPGSFVGVTQDVKEGQSGGPVLDRFGRAVAVVTWTWRDRRGGYAIPIADATRMLSERPLLDDPRRRAGRARLRATEFFEALGRNDVDVARRMTSPTRARKVRSQTVERIAETMRESGSQAVQHFFVALESLAGGEPLDDVVAVAMLQDLVIRTGSHEFREALGVEEDLSREQVLAFFFEVGQAYLRARRAAGKDPGDALDAALRHLQTVEAARTFAFAGFLRAFDGSAVKIERVQVLPGEYAPRAVVTLRMVGGLGWETSANGLTRATVQSAVPGRRLVALHLRLEWGDWYVSDVTPAA
jgi:hypothetical protein